MRYAIKNIKLVTRGKNKGLYAIAGAQLCKEGCKPETIQNVTPGGYKSAVGLWAQIEILSTLPSGAYEISEQKYNELLALVKPYKVYQTPESRQESKNAAGWVYLASNITDIHCTR